VLDELRSPLLDPGLWLNDERDVHIDESRSLDDEARWLADLSCCLDDRSRSLADETPPPRRPARLLALSPTKVEKSASRFRRNPVGPSSP
jgi:hypothetical protein